MRAMYTIKRRVNGRIERIGDTIIEMEGNPNDYANCDAAITSLDCDPDSVIHGGPTHEYWAQFQQYEGT